MTDNAATDTAATETAVTDNAAADTSGNPDANATVDGAADEFELEIHLRWGDMDSLAHVNNVQVARLFEEARVRAFAEWFSARRSGLGLLVARQDIEYHSPLAYTPEPVRIRARITRVGTASFEFGYTLTDPAGTVCAVARTTMVVIDTATGKPAPIPDEMRAQLELHHGEPVRFRSA